MKSRSLVVFSVLTLLPFAACLLAVHVEAKEESSTAGRPVLIELFTSEGCSSCPPADQLLATLLAEQPVPKVQIIPLAFHVDYWNDLGWRDRFSSSAHSRRQSTYAEKLELEGPYTPQLVVDGVTQTVGHDRNAALQLIHESAAAPKVDVTLDVAADRSRGDRASVEIEVAAPGGHVEKSDVLLAVTEDGLVTNVERGENATRRLSHVAVVRSFDRVGSFDGKKAFTKSRRIDLDRDWQREALKVILVVQEKDSGRVIGLAARQLSTPAS
ncbi:MAG: DUF1223 domain-containing protein [Luteitalea sp.]|nr:DUF1223 domain-containing protein [Luteitalea sp.]